MAREEAKEIGATHYLKDSGEDDHYLKNENGCWYSWGFKTPNSKTRTQWNEQSGSVIEYFSKIIKPL